FIAHTHAGFAAGSGHGFALWHGNRLVGACGLNAVDMTNLRANLGYWIASSESGRGLVTRAVRQLIHWSFAETALERLEIIAAVGNVRSQRVAERVGAAREGVLARRVWVRPEPDTEPSRCVLGAGILYAVVRPTEPGVTGHAAA
ncbi:MAG: GNAT family N-acetyltransferase, partial [Gammaproteobacteria bacterium]